MGWLRNQVDRIKEAFGQEAEDPLERGARKAFERLQERYPQQDWPKDWHGGPQTGWENEAMPGMVLTTDPAAMADPEPETAPPVWHQKYNEARDNGADRDTAEALADEATRRWEADGRPELQDELEEAWQPAYWDTRENGPGWDLPGHPDQYRDPEREEGARLAAELETAKALDTMGGRTSTHYQDKVRAGGHIGFTAEETRAIREAQEHNAFMGEQEYDTDDPGPYWLPGESRETEPEAEEEGGEIGPGETRGGVANAGGDLNISGAAIGPGSSTREGQQPARDQGRTAGQREVQAGQDAGGPYVYNSRGQINMDRTAVGPNAQVTVNGPETQWGPGTQPGQREPREPEAGLAGPRTVTERDRLIEEFSREYPEISVPEMQQAEINKDAAENWDGAVYPPYVGPGYTEPPADWEGWHEPHSEHEREHYWDNPEHDIPPEPQSADYEPIPEAEPF